MQNDFFRRPVFAYVTGGLICLLSFMLAWQQASLLSFSLFFVVAIATVLLVATLLRSFAVQASLEGDDTNLQRDAELAHRLSELLQNILPLWNSHVETVKTHSEQSVHQLILSFSSMVSEFDKAGFGGVSNIELNTSKNSDATITLLQLCKKELAPVINSLSQMIDSKDDLLNCIRDLAKSTADMNSMAHEVGQIAAQTNLLAINAAIEAARVGIQGRGFAVVADEVRKLSHLSAETGKRMAERVEHISQVMKVALSAADRSAIQDKRVLEVSGAVVRDVLSHVETMGDAAEEMRHHGNVIRSDIEDLLVTLQFQDRISQILQVVMRDIAKLQKTAAELDRGTLPDTSTWLEELQNTYTMHDEHQNHGTRGAAASNNESEITFF
ncbi:methyl-accepting chemotaxis protein [Undibacterium cyanobacteriorum]|uniref:Methyl-accepting chemotaxis protein n=1 Tax=Undibacterium cyanobacteriorum TaxID=3073561 RepID=A0ABY9RGL0_9BURK|nr:methyl-accepting chemotaxis protein [Undibacterium sp. 20NA77.5]WMW79993.1 methyl-accepting chemotaxis protein [Undibacterium sp. 20NA77.5]